MIRFATISPCFNEELILEDSASRLNVLFDHLIERQKITEDSKIIFVNDGSSDTTWSIIRNLHQKNPRICGIDLAHNVGHQNAIMAGMLSTTVLADAVVTIDADLQDDLDAIEHMIDAHLNGAEIVYGIKVCREADSWIKRNSAQLFYKVMNSMGVQTIYNHADFRLMSQKAIRILSQYQEKNLYLRGLIPTIGLQTASVDDYISPRKAGESKYTLRKMIRLASDGVTSFSTRPIELIFSVGVGMLLVAIAMFCYVLGSLVLNHYTAGWASIMMSLWFIGAIVTISIGVVGTYIGKIYIEVKQRPLYVVNETIGIED